MAIGSMDAVTLMPRTIGAAETQGKEMNQNQHIADQNAVQFQQNTEHEMRQTVETQESETDDYDGDGSGGSGAGRQSGSKREKRDASKRQKMAPRSNSSFDIMV